MKNLSEKLLLVAAGVAVGAVGYMAWKHRDELPELIDAAVNKGKELLDEQIKDFTEVAAKAAENAADSAKAATGGDA